MVMLIPVNLGENSYDIIVRRGCIGEAAKLLDLDRKVLVVTDSGVPKEYADGIASLCKEPCSVTVPMGEQSKSLDNYALLLRTMLENSFTRSDCVVAVGGGVVGDLAGFAAASYMRGIDFYNVPTTLLSQIDSSIGGKTAVNFSGVKNVVGAFYQPKRVLIDPNVLKTLPSRHLAAGMAEAVKMALTSDAELFEHFENDDIDIDRVIVSSLKIKKDIVEKDEKESGLRRMLNFGHTVGHGIESAENGKLFHGECVALGMLPMCGDALRTRVRRVLLRLGLPIEVKTDSRAVADAMSHDKKFNGDLVTVVKADEPGKGYFDKISGSELKAIAKTFIEEGAIQ